MPELKVLGYQGTRVVFEVVAGVYGIDPSPWPVGWNAWDLSEVRVKTAHPSRGGRA